MQVTDTVDVAAEAAVGIYVPNPKALAVTVQVAWTVAETAKVVVAVAATAGVEKLPNIRHERVAAMSVDLAVFTKFTIVNSC